MVKSHKPSLAEFSNKTCQEQETIGGKEDEKSKNRELLDTSCAYSI